MIAETLLMPACKEMVKIILSPAAERRFLNSSISRHYLSPREEYVKSDIKIILRQKN
jgi:hypothetical protein